MQMRLRDQRSWCTSVRIHDVSSVRAKLRLQQIARTHAEGSVVQTCMVGKLAWSCVVTRLVQLRARTMELCRAVQVGKPGQLPGMGLMVPVHVAMLHITCARLFYNGGVHSLYLCSSTAPAWAL